MHPSFVCRCVVSAPEGLGAEVAPKRFLVAVLSPMSITVEAPCELLTADIAAERPHTRMRQLVKTQRGPLRIAAAADIAFERPFSGMDAAVITEIVLARE